MIITIKEVKEEIVEGTTKFIEWTCAGGDGKDIKVKLYPTLKQGDEWLHFEDRFEEFRNAKDKTYEIERANIKVDKGYWKPVIKADEIKNVLKQEAIKEIQKGAVDTRQASIEGQVAIKAIVDLWIAGKLTDKDREVEVTRLWLIDRLNKTFFGAEDAKEIKTPDKVDSETLDSSRGEQTEKRVDDDAWTAEKIFKYVAEKMKWKNTSPAKTWIINTIKIEPSLLETDPKEALELIKQRMGW